MRASMSHFDAFVHTQHPQAATDCGFDASVDLVQLSGRF